MVPKGSNTKKDRPVVPVITEVLPCVSTGNAGPVLHEVKHALGALLHSGCEHTIDLGAIPFSSEDERILEDALGIGEVYATLSVGGESHVRETAIPGVWRVDHLDESGELQSRFVEVTFMPEILKSQHDDAERGLAALSAYLDG